MARSSSSINPPPRRQSLFCVRFSILVLLGLGSAASVYFFEILTGLQTKISEDESTISSLHQSIRSQQLIINRFNESVTNADVQKRVAELEQSLHETENMMLSSLDNTTIQIQTLLNATVASLDATVTKAQADIQYEVGIVKADVEKYVRTTQDQFSMENSFMVWQLAGTFTVLACLISMWHMTAHVRKFKRPFVQRKILAILWMSPIYGITSWLSLVFPQYEGYLAICKDFYEGYVIYQFLSFLISVLGRGDRATVVNVLAKHADHLEPPVRLCGCFRGKYPAGDPRSLADAILMQCQVFTMQFVFFKPMTAIGLFTCMKLGINGDGPFDYKCFPFWFKIIQNLSVFVAFSGLLKVSFLFPLLCVSFRSFSNSSSHVSSILMHRKFYHAVQEDLGWCRPFSKFLCIKGIVFMTFWQSMVLAFLANSTNMASGKNDKDSDPDLWGKQAQNFLICLEMLLFSIAHFYCFPTEEWEDGYRPAFEKKMSAGDNLALGDFVSDLKLILRGSDSEKKKRRANTSEKSDHEGTQQIEEDISILNTIAEVKEAEDCGDADIEVGTSEINADLESFAGSTHSSDSSDLSYASPEAPPHECDDTTHTGSDLDNSFVSFDAEHLSASLRSSLNQAFANTDEDVRDAASRLLPLMEKIGEEDEAEITEIAGPVQRDNGNYGSLFNMNNEDSTESTFFDGDDNAFVEEGRKVDDETTSLLQNSAKNNVQLRPSIFTSPKL